MRAKVVQADCREVIAKLPNDSIDSVVTDPPYELGFMGKKWDNTGIAYDVALWKDVLRVLKPGGYALVFGGSRTYHRMACALEDAGFEIVDSIHWIYGSGFPKALDISKAIDKKLGADRPQVMVPNTPGNKPYSVTGTEMDKDGYKTGLGFHDESKAVTPEAQQWEGWKTQLKPAHEPVVIARKPFKGTFADNVLKYGTGAFNINGCRVGTGTGEVKTVNYPDIRGNNYEQGNSAYADKPPVQYEVKDQGRFPANVVFSHSPECKEIGVSVDTSVNTMRTKPMSTGTMNSGNWENAKDVPPEKLISETPVFKCAEGCPVADLDAQSGTSKSSVGKTRSGGRSGGVMGNHVERSDKDEPFGFNDQGGASRYFPVFKYQAKAPTKERPKVDGKAHSTVKPLALMQWLCRLVTQPGGIVLEPFAGSGTTVQAALDEGFKCIATEFEADHIPLIQQRLAAYPGVTYTGTSQPNQ